LLPIIFEQFASEPDECLWVATTTPMTAAANATMTTVVNATMTTVVMIRPHGVWFWLTIDSLRVNRAVQWRAGSPGSGCCWGLI
jgi:hypothetical protein